MSDNSSYLVSVLESLHARISSLEAKGNRGSTNFEHGRSGSVREYFPLSKRLALSYSEAMSNPTKKRALGLNGHWSLGKDEAPHMYGTGTRNGDKWSISFTEHSPDVLDVDAYLTNGDDFDEWHMVARSTTEVIAGLNGFFQG